MSLCDNCKRVMFDKTCSIPLEDGMYQWSKQREVLNDDGTCKYHDPETLKDVVLTKIQRPYYRVLRGVDTIKDFVRYRMYNRLKYGFDIRDCWSLQNATAEFMLPRLRKFIDDKPMGVPGVLTIREYVEENALVGYFSGDLQDEWFGEKSDVDESMKAWLTILEKIYYSLDYEVNQWDGKFETFYHNEYGERELDIEKHTAMMNEVREGYRLLGIFFQNLWD